MAMRFLEKEAVLNLLKLAERNATPPPEITNLKRKIALATRAAEIEAEAGRINYDAINEIVNMKLRLDSLYGLWAEGKIG